MVRPRRLGVLQVRPRAGAGERDVAILRDELARLGWRDGRELVIDARFAEGDVTRVRSLAAEILAAKPDAVVAAPTATVATLRRLTASVPLILVGGGDPVGAGLAASLARPGSNVTGLSTLLEVTVQKNLEILREIVPERRRFAILITTNNVNQVRYVAEAEAAAAALGIMLTSTVIDGTADLEAATTVWSRAGCEALSVLPDGLLAARLHDVIAVAKRARLPAIYPLRAFAEAGGLISYGADTTKFWRRAAWYVDRIFRGASPGELPIEQSTQFEMVVNQGAARALGLTLPQALLARADEVIE